MHELRTQRRIEFSDTDLGGNVHFSRFFIFMETAEDEFLRALGGSYTMVHEGREMGWPKVAASCDYKKPIYYGETIEIHVRVARRSPRTVSYEFEFRRGDDEIARGRTTSVCCARRPEGGYESIPIPESLAAKIEEAPG